MSAALKCAKCGAGRGGVINMVRDGHKAPLLCFSCEQEAEAAHAARQAERSRRR